MKKAVTMINLQVLFLAGVLMSGLLPTARAQATDSVRLVVIGGEGLRSGELKDGTRIARGFVSSQEKHSGFHVWSDTQTVGNKPEQYILTGMQNGGSRIRVRLVSDGWSPDTVDGKGIKKTTDENGSAFDIVVDGNQKVVSDRYRIELKGDTISVSSGEDNSSDATSQTAYINLAQTVKVLHELKATQSRFDTNLSPLTILAKGTVSADDGSKNRYAIRFSPGSCKSVQNDSTGFGMICTLPGKNINNSLDIYMYGSGYSTQPDNSGWLVWTTATKTGHYEIGLTKLIPNVPADSYKVSVDAAIWID